MVGVSLGIALRQLEASNDHGTLQGKLDSESAPSKWEDALRLLTASKAHVQQTLMMASGGTRLLAAAATGDRYDGVSNLIHCYLL